MFRRFESGVEAVVEWGNRHAGVLIILFFSALFFYAASRI